MSISGSRSPTVTEFSSQLKMDRTKYSLNNYYHKDMASEANILSKENIKKAFCVLGVAVIIIMVLLMTTIVVVCLLFFERGSLYTPPLTKISDVQHSTYAGPLNVLGKQLQKMGSIGAQLSANQTLLEGNPPLLSWSHQGADNYLEGINHVMHHYDNKYFDCLHVTSDGRYLVAVQLTYRYTINNPLKSINSHYTLTKFRSNAPFTVAKNHFIVPDPSRRVNGTVRQSVTMVQLVLLLKEDRLCVTVSQPSLIYPSKIDNFFAALYL